jgi:hypothetical protein
MTSSGNAELGEKFGVGAGDHMGGDEFADPASGVGTGINSGFDAADIAFDDDSEEAATNLDLAD